MKNIMSCILSALSALAFTITCALAQPSPPPDPWINTGSTISYGIGTVVVGSPSGTAITSPGNINVSGAYYVNGVPIASIPCTYCAVTNASNIFTAAQTINLNSATLPSAQTGTGLQIGGAAGTTVRAELDAFAAVPRYTCVRTDGTIAAKTTLQSGDEICSLNAFGYNGSAVVGPQAAIRTYAAQNWSVGSNGTYLRLGTTPNGSATLTDALGIEQDGSVTVGSAAFGTSVGAGNINLAGGAVYNNGTAPIGTGPYLRSAAVNSAVLSTNSSGVPSFSTTLPSGLTATNMALTGAPTAPTQALNDNTTKIATDAFVQAQLAAGSGALVPGTTPISPKTNGGILNDNNGILVDTLPANLGIVTAVTLEQYGGGTGVSDNTTALAALYTANPNGGYQINLKIGTYQFASPQPAFQVNGVCFVGQGSGATTLQFNGTSGTFLTFGGKTNTEQGDYCLKGLSIYAPDTTGVKKAIEAFDFNNFQINDLQIFGAGTNSTWTGGGASVAIQTHGRQFFKAYGYNFLAADMPFQISINPDTYIAADKFDLSNIYFQGNSNGPLITVDPGALVDLTILNSNWVGGTHGLYFNDTSAENYVSQINSAGTAYAVGDVITLNSTGGSCSTPIKVKVLAVSSGAITTAAVSVVGVCASIPTFPASQASTTGSGTGATFTLQNIATGVANLGFRSEQGTSTSNYSAYLSSPVNGFYRLRISNASLDSYRSGVYARGIKTVTLQDTTFIPPVSTTGINIDTSNGTLSFDNTYWGPNSTATNTMVAYWTALPPSGTALYPFGRWEGTGSGVVTTTFGAFGGMEILGSSSGAVSFAVPAVAGTNTLTFPAATANMAYQVGALTNGHCMQASGTAGGLSDSGAACGGTGTVSSIATTSPITGGTITTTGTIGCATCVTSAASLTSNNLMIGSGSQASATTTTGSGVLTALGNGVDTSGGVQLYGYSNFPALSANQVLGALTATAPAGLAMPPCSGTANALTWVSGSGFGCSNNVYTAVGNITGLGTGVATALADNTNSSGGFVTSPVANANLANSTISGVALGSNLNTLTFGPHLASGGTSYNGGSAVTISTDATSSSTASTLVSRDVGGSSAFANVAASTINGNTITTGTGTLTIAAGKTLTQNNTLTFTGTDSSSVAFGGGGTVTYTIANGTAALGTSAISSGACASVVTSSASGVATTDTILAAFNGDPTGVTGYAPATSGMLTIISYPTSGNVNFKVCNNTGSSITPGAITLNWRVLR